MNTEAQVPSTLITDVEILSLIGEEAVALAREGFAIFPVYEIAPNGYCACGRSDCSSPGKHPRLKNGVKGASTSEEQARQWWTVWPDANIGIATGACSSIFVLDVDSKHNGQDALVALMEQHGQLSDTRISQTGGGGFHAFYRLPVDRDIPNSAGKVGQGIDIRGEGGYVVAPPSRHASGRTYEWRNRDCPIGPAPEWLVELCYAPPKPRSQAISNGEATGTTSEFLSEGRRNNDFTAVAGFLRSKGFAVDSVKNALASVNAQIAAPLPANEIDTIARSSGRWPAHIKLDELYFTSVLVNAFDSKIRHCTPLGWTIYDGAVWRPDDGEKFVTEIAKKAAEEFAAYAETLHIGDKPRFSETAIASVKKRSFISNALKLASSDTQVTAAVSDFDADRSLLCLENGTLDLRTGTLIAHQAEHMLTRMMPISFDPLAGCPVFDQFLAETLPTEDAAFAMRAFAYALTGSGNEQKFVIFHGVGRNGKSTLVKIMAKLFGEYAANAEPTSFLRRSDNSASNDIARLARARLVTTSEFPNGAVLDVPLIKRITGQDKLTARHLYKEHFEFEPHFLLLMVTNYMPVIEGSDAAVARRVLAVPFRSVVPVENVDPDLDRKLWGERSGILNRLLGALRQYRELGLAPSENVQAKTDAFLDDTNLIKRFAEACCEFSPLATASVTEMYWRFRSTCFEEGIKPMSQRSFGQQLEQAHSLTKRRVSKGVEWVGVKVK
jgi:putative DNA primase/helicase